MTTAEEDFYGDTGAWRRRRDDMIVIGWRETMALMAVAIALLVIGVGLGVLGSLTWTARDVATCHALRADAYESSLGAKQALDECVRAVVPPRDGR